MARPLDGFTFKHGADGTFEIAHTEDDARFSDFIDENSGTAVEHMQGRMAVGLEVDHDLGGHERGMQLTMWQV